MSEILRLKKSNCKNCYKCIRHCPVKSIKFSGNQAHIIGDDCILCGQCFVVCPQNAKEIADSTEEVNCLLNSGKRIVASVAPSFVAYFEGVGFEALSKSLIELGFAAAEETAIGATLVKREYEKQIRAATSNIIISSCCPSVNLLIQKYYPNLLGCLSPVVTPMAAHALNIKKRYPDANVVFIGPCLSKKDEAMSGPADAVLTFAELGEMFGRKGIVPELRMDSAEKTRARLFPTVGGILKTMDLPDNGYTYMTVDGIENCMNALDDISRGDISKCFIEMSSCQGSCIGGPVMGKYKNSPIRHLRSAVTYAGRSDFEVENTETSVLRKNYHFTGRTQTEPTEKEITDILRKMGKTGPEQELNCGTCGYNTCREKARAVCQGKADISMCLPFLMDKSESFTNTILNNTPNGILVVNEDLEVQQANNSVLRMLGIKYVSDILGEPVVRLFDPLPFLNTLDGKTVKDKLDYYPEYKKYIELTLAHDKASRIIIAILRDVTDVEGERQKKEALSKQTIEIADKVVDKQMRIVQEIASLLGETAAETKIALTKLKESMGDEE